MVFSYYHFHSVLRLHSPLSYLSFSRSNLPIFFFFLNYILPSNFTEFSLWFFYNVSWILTSLMFTFLHISTSITFLPPTTFETSHKFHMQYFYYHYKLFLTSISFLISELCISMFLYPQRSQICIHLLICLSPISH